ncbi:MAG: hypothetical protein FWD48_02960 [Oscillospiraceae bacterium]|nr:hypothetical protein [Oscillospiraceae bacterium]
MTQLIGHYYDENRIYSTFCVSELHETANLYVRTDETLSDATDTLDNWEALNKSHLGRLRPLKSGGYTMYLLQEDLSRFKEKVEAALAFRQNVKIITPQSAGRGSR